MTKCAVDSVADAEAVAHHHVTVAIAVTVLQMAPDPVGARRELAMVAGPAARAAQLAVAFKKFCVKP